MSTNETLKDVYADEMKDLWSANDQMVKVMKVMASKAHDTALKTSLEQSVKGIERHAQTLKALIGDTGADVEPEHCKGMEGLVKEATKHIGADAPKAPELRDIVIIAQYQRMSHYGIAGFGTAAAYAKALGMQEHAEKLAKIVGDIYAGDQYASQQAATAEKMAAKMKKAA